jgi:hypothetical protein
VGIETFNVDPTHLFSLPKMLEREVRSDELELCVDFEALDRSPTDNAARLLLHEIPSKRHKQWRSASNVKVT